MFSDTAFVSVSLASTREGVRPRSAAESYQHILESYQHILVIIIIMTNEKRQAKNSPRPPMTAFPRLAGCLQLESWAGTCDEALGVMHHHCRIRHHVTTRSSQALRRGGLTSRGTYRTDPMDRQVMRGHDVAITRQWRQVYLSVTL
jgi:hypothetical protein